MEEETYATIIVKKINSDLVNIMVLKKGSTAGASFERTPKGRKDSLAYIKKELNLDEV